MILVEQASKQYGSETVLHDINLNVQSGEFFGIIGPNGSGKSTLLSLLSGVEQVSSGRIYLDNQEVNSYKRKELAQWVAVLQQDALPPVGFTVREVIEMGRFPFQNWLGDEEEDPESLIQGIIETLSLETVTDRPVEVLSGGQRQRVALAKVMAQQPNLLLLDEPTTFLDIGYQVQMMDYVRKWQAECGLTVVAVLHDLNLASQYCSRLLVLHEGKVAATGTPQEVLTEELIERVYGTSPIILSHPESSVPQILLKPGSNAKA
ncbi:ABC transporter ATP-binding protein [Paenibacillus larvae]|uniref:ABC transporter ATP-binding protein n=3 Tax=Paenibacillus larvae TaxID=1464 RepID=A0AAP5JRX2_9BACL|nr:ABC transporter ATP-binding protein [Paenibacillus larvae]AHD07285.1 putative ABC transporter ATP-binding protein YvrA [Paenibacillus larvae subsp. larvae DSM 25430]AVF23628.1 putative ABC transporter ATP-binding protein YvrA [Paenibacillus larvae subsp. larvae]AVG13849.1 putative ABC transporter ATP-binding protein YvrA [Paenibacillus larvae subsp. larvae DSM 25430]ETK29704.1 putative ABC transporter ATP-binding protein YvrA [Paenibacillus larvae subsp. larvae DSM 25719]MCY7476532.1 ABC tr